MNKLLFCLLAACCISLLQQADAQTLNNNWWTPNGNVNAVYQSGSQLFIGGQFDYVGPNTPFGAYISKSSGMPNISYAKPNNLVNCSIPDGNGGWYIGGIFSGVNGQVRNGLAHINADGSLNPWSPAITSPQIFTLALSGSTLYVGGIFSALGGQSRSNIGAVDTGTGLATSWNPNSNDQVNCLVVSGSKVYVGGYFSTIGGQTRKRIAALNNTTGTATAWNPNVATPSNASVYTILVNGPTLYTGGSFTGIGGQSRNNIAALDTATGTATSWNPNAGSVVTTMNVSGSKMYAGGYFTSIGGQTRTYLAALDLSTGLATSWNPGANNIVRALSVSGSSVYVGGDFTVAGGQSRNSLAAIDTLSASATGWNPNIRGTGYNNHNIYTLCTADTAVYIGGAFSSAGGQARKNLAALNVNTGVLTAWNPNANGAVSALVVANGKVYVGADGAASFFDTVGGLARNHFAVLDTTAGACISWDPALSGTSYLNTRVLSLAAADSKVYIGGSFNGIGGQSRANLAAIDVGTDAVTSWNPGCNYGPETMVYSSGLLYAGGSFSTIGGQSRSYLAALDTLTGAATSWNPNPNNTVVALAVSGSTLYAGGNFSTVGGQTRSNLAAINTATNAVTAWNPAPDGTAYRIAASGPVVYVGGSFSTIGGQSRSRFAGIDAATGNATTWDPATGGGTSVNALLTSGNTLYGGGSFYGAGADNVFYGNLVVYNNIPATPTISITASANPICAGLPVTFTATVSNGGASPTYQWTKNTFAISGATGSTYTSSTLMTYDTIGCIVTSSNTGNYTATSNAVVMTVNTCTPVITSLSPTTNFCQGSTVAISFNASGFNAGNIFTAQLSNASGSFAAPVSIGTLTSTTGGTINATIPAAQAAGSAYRIRIVASSPAATGADNGASLSVIAQPTTAQVAISPSATQTICTGNSVTLSVPATAGCTYQWFNNAVAIAGATGNTYPASAGGTYTAQVTNAAGCSRLSSGRIVSLKPAPVATISPAAGQNLCGATTSVAFSVNATSGATYQWKNNGTAIAGATATTYSATAAGSYSVTVTGSTGCATTSSTVAVTANCSVAISDTGAQKLCAGSNVTANFSTSGFTAGNVFTLQLSDASGSFASAVNIGTLAATSGGNVTGMIPAGTAAGNGYKLRINTSNPATTGTASPLTIQVRNAITDNVQLCAVSVDSATGKNMLIWNKPVSSNIDSFVFYRQGNTAVYARAGAQAYAAFSTWIDNGSAPAVHADRYYITAKNVCGETAQSAMHKTMHLTINKGTDNATWNLIWNGYEGVTHTYYNIYRGTTATNLSLLASIAAGSYNSYTDNSAPAGAIYYKVTVGDAPACNPSFRTTGGGMEIASNIASSEAAFAANYVDMTVYPNPSNAAGTLLIESSNADEPYEVRVMDVTGRLAQRLNAAPDKEATFGESLAPGMYTVEAVSGNGKRVVKKWVKQ